MVHLAAGAQSAAGDEGDRRPRSARPHGTDRDGARGHGRLGNCAGPGLAGVRHRELLESAIRPARRGGDRRRHPGGHGRAAGVDLSRVGTPRRQTIPADLAGNRTRGRRTDQGSPRLESRSRQPAAHDPCRGADRRGLLLLQAGARRRRPAGRHERTRRLPHVGRHRLTGRRLAADAPRLSRDVRPLSQLPDTLARVAGKGPRAGDVC